MGTKRALREIKSIVNEKGIRIAGRRSLPLWWTVLYVGVPFVVLTVGLGLNSVGTIGGILGGLLMLLFGVFMIVGWPLSGVVVYWDWKASKRYSNIHIPLGRLFALVSVVLGPASVIFYLLLRRRVLA